MAWRIRSAVVRLRPMARQIPAQVQTLTACYGGRLDLQVLREGFGRHSLIVQSKSDSGLLPPKPVDNSGGSFLSVDN
jgi:hypothetical protein